jgi:hypothetical protein
VDFRGAFDSSQAVEHAPMMYQGGAGAGVFLAQIFTHAAISSSMQKDKLSKQQVQANKVLAPIEKLLKNLSQESLVHDSDLYTFFNESESDGNIILTSLPIFFMSQDMASITLKHVVTVQQANQKGMLYQNVIEVISPVIATHDLNEELKKNGGMRLNKITKSLYEYSLSLALADLKGEYNNSESLQESFRFHQGNQLRFERGVSIKNDESNSVIRNLRGWLVAFPSSLDNKKSM